jgi:hypothetical protein
MDAEERREIEERLTVVERDLARVDTGTPAGGADAERLRGERNELRARLAAHGRRDDGTAVQAARIEGP